MFTVDIARARYGEEGASIVESAWKGVVFCHKYVYLGLLLKNIAQFS